VKGPGITSPDPQADTSPEVMSIVRCNAAAEAIDQVLKTVTNGDARAALLVAAEHFRALAHRMEKLRRSSRKLT